MSARAHNDIAAPQPRTIVSGFRVSPEERVKLSKLAIKAGARLSPFIRQRALRGHLRMISSEACASHATLVELKRITTNLQQIATEFETRDWLPLAGVLEAAQIINAFVLEQIVSDAPELGTAGQLIRSDAPHRTIGIKVRYAPHEHDDLRSLASRAGISVSHYMRAQALDGAVAVVQPAADFSHDGQARLHDLGQILNRYTHRLNAGGDLPGELSHIVSLIHHTVSGEIQHAARPRQIR